MAKKKGGISGIIVVLVFVALFMSSLGGPFSLMGFTTLQVSQIDFLSSDPFLNGKVWAVTIVPGGMSQWIEGTTKSTTVDSSQLASDGFSAERPLKIDITKHQESCQYITQPSDLTPIYQFGYEIYDKTLFGLGFCPSNLHEDCLKKGTPLVEGNFADAFSTKCLCIYRTTTEPVVSRLSSPTRVYETEITISNGQSVESVTLTNPGITEAQIGNIARVKAIGLASTNPCPSSSSYLASGSGDNWKLISKANYERYINKLDDIKNTQSIKNPDALNQIVSFANQYSDVARGESKWCLMTGECASNEKNKFLIKPAVPVTNIFVQLYVKADWLGVVQPVAVPKISCNSITEIGSSGGAIKVSVRNIGVGRGNLEIWADCDSPVTQDGGNVETFLEPNQVKQVSVWVGSSKVNQPTTVNCEMIARAGSKTDSCITRIRVNPDMICSPFEKTCRDDAIMQCNNFGTEWLTAQRCTSTEICQYESGVPACVGKDAPLEEAQTPWGLIILAALIGGGVLFWKTKR